MNDKTILRIKVPANLYESVKAQLTLDEAKKGKQNLGAGMEVVKEKKSSGDKPKKAAAPKAEKPKKAKAPKMDDDIPHDGMKKMDKKERSLEELMKIHEMLGKKIEEMQKVEEYHEPENVYDDEIEDDKKKVKESRDLSGYFTGKQVNNASTAIKLIDAAIKAGKEVKIDGETVIDTAPAFHAIITGTEENPKAHKLSNIENISKVTIDGQPIEAQVSDMVAAQPKLQIPTGKRDIEPVGPGSRFD